MYFIIISFLDTNLPIYAKKMDKHSDSIAHICDAALMTFKDMKEFYVRTQGLGPCCPNVKLIMASNGDNGISQVCEKEEQSQYKHITMVTKQMTKQINLRQLEILNFECQD